jgi:hypothetical protein
MNVSLQNATVQGNDDLHYHFEEFFVRARNIRYVQIPEDVKPFLQNQLFDNFLNFRLVFID